MREIIANTDQFCVADRPEFAGGRGGDSVSFGDAGNKSIEVACDDTFVSVGINLNISEVEILITWLQSWVSRNK